MSHPDKGKNIALFLTCFSIVATVALVGFVIYFSGHKEPSSTQTSTESTMTPIPPPECYSAEEAGEHVGERDCVDFNVGYTYETSAGTKFIDQYENYSEGFQIYIPAGSSASSMPLAQFDDKDIRVSGLIRDYNGATQITVTDSSQIKIFE